MRIILFSLGSRGDIQPILALASRLNREGHTAVVSSSPDFAELAASHGIEYAPIGPSLTTIGDAEEISKIVESGNILKLILYGRKIRNMQSNIVQQCIQESWQVAQGADAILYKPPAAIIGYNIAEKLGIPCAELALFPVYRTRVFPSFMLGGGKNRGPLLNDLFWRLSELLFWQLMQRGTANRQRREILDLPPLPLSGPYQQQEREGMPVFNAYSPSVLPRPADWPARMHVTGYYFSAPPPRTGSLLPNW
uniref:Glycosyltransferase family 28 N-terminal domain-containing protein n=1 Tax=Thermosporothrix sp. COM3 TaxID=2490863 RepID=A0A455SGF9_9CHLR|nr:hypothetical protein KTC_22940 [Thermosporothrix sp. COM3]